MNLYKQLVEKKAKLSLVGLGYVGMPIAVAFAKKIKVVGFDLNKVLDAIFIVRISRHVLCPLFSSAREGARPPAVAGA